MDVSHEYTRDFALGDLGQDTPRAQPQGKSGVIPQFFMMALPDEAATVAKGRACYIEVEMVRLLMPGDRNSAPERRVSEFHKDAYPRHYEAFKKQQELAPEGTLIDNWPLLNRAQVYDLKAANVFTVEQLAALSDEQLGIIGLGARMLRKNAQAFLAAAESGKPSAQIVAENEELKNKILLLTVQMSDMAKNMERLMLKAGENPIDHDNPLAAAKRVMLQANNIDASIVVPDNFTSLGLPKLKEIVAQIAPNHQVRNKDEALEMINEYLGKRAAVAA